MFNKNIHKYYLVPEFNRFVRNVPSEAGKISDMAANAEKLENWEGASGDVAQNQINTQCESAITEHKGKTDEAVKVLDEGEKTEIQKILAEEKPEPGNKNAADWKKWKKDHDALWSKVKTVQQETATKKGEAIKAHEAARTQFYAMRDAAIHKMRAAFEVRAQSEEMIKKSLETVAGDSEYVREAMKKANFAANLADDGTLSSWGGEVQDYLDSEIGGRKLNDSELEDITMGIVATMHNGDKNDENDPARKFMQGLSDREANSGEFWSTDDRGVRARDVQLQILKNLGYDVVDRNERQDAAESDAGKLISKIAANNDLPPQLRGMLLGQLASADSSQRDEMVKGVEQMFELAQKAQAGGLNNVDIDLPGSIGEKAILGVTGYLSLVAAFPTYGLSLAAEGAAVQGHMDREALGKAGVAFTALKDAQEMIQFSEMRAQYEVGKKISGITDPKIEEMIENAEKTPSKMRKAAKGPDLRDALATYLAPPAPTEAVTAAAAASTGEVAASAVPAVPAASAASAVPAVPAADPKVKAAGVGGASGGRSAGSASGGAGGGSSRSGGGGGGGGSARNSSSPKTAETNSSDAKITKQDVAPFNNKYDTYLSKPVAKEYAWVKDLAFPHTGSQQYYEVEKDGKTIGVSYSDSDGVPSLVFDVLKDK